MAATALLKEEKNIAILPIYMSRSNGDQQWAYKAAEKDTIKDALKELELHLDGEKTALVAANEFFVLCPTEEKPISRAAVSSFWFRVRDMGGVAEMSIDMMILKFLNFVPQRSKFFEKMKDSIKADMSEADMTKIYEEVQRRVDQGAGKEKEDVKKEEVFVNNEPSNR